MVSWERVPIRHLGLTIKTEPKRALNTSREGELVVYFFALFGGIPGPTVRQTRHHTCVETRTLEKRGDKTRFTRCPVVMQKS